MVVEKKLCVFDNNSKQKGEKWCKYKQSSFSEWVLGCFPKDLPRLQAG